MSLTGTMLLEAAPADSPNGGNITVSVSVGLLLVGRVRLPLGGMDDSLSGLWAMSAPVAGTMVLDTVNYYLKLTCACAMHASWLPPAGARGLVPWER